MWQTNEVIGVCVLVGFVASTAGFLLSALFQGVGASAWTGSTCAQCGRETERQHFADCPDVLAKYPEGSTYAQRMQAPKPFDPDTWKPARRRRP